MAYDAIPPPSCPTATSGVGVIRVDDIEVIPSHRTTPHTNDSLVPDQLQGDAL